MRRSPLISVALAVALTLIGCSTTNDPASARATAGDSSQTAPKRPSLRITELASGLALPWDVKRIAPHQFLFTERDSATLNLIDHGQVSQVDFPSSSVWVSGETGLMGLEVDPDFATNRRFYTCQGGTTPTGHDVRVMAWTLSDDMTRATEVQELLGGLPASSGRHGGCRLLIAKDGSLYVGTGDAAIGPNPQDLHGLGGKTLRLDRMTGEPWPTNPWIKSANHNRRYLQTYGHRNVQGLAQRADGTIWSVEHGPDKNDEINLLVDRGNYGWNPVDPSDPATGYNEAVPMTDYSLPGRQIGAKWSSGSRTWATSGASWTKGAKWGSLRGQLAVASLKDSKLTFFRFDSTGRYVSRWTPTALTRYGRLRSVTALPNGLLVTSSNGAGDVILRVEPN